MDSEYANRLIEQKYNGKLKDGEWLYNNFVDLYFYLEEVIDYDSDHYLIFESNVGNTMDTDISVTVVLNSQKNVYMIKATVMKDKEKWDDEHWLNTSCLRCIYSNSMKDEQQAPIYSGVYNEFSWNTIKDSILSKEFTTVSYKVFT